MFEPILLLLVCIEEFLYFPYKEKAGVSGSCYWETMLQMQMMVNPSFTCRLDNDCSFLWLIWHINANQRTGPFAHVYAKIHLTVFLALL
jgi:hypothetical protein